MTGSGLNQIEEGKKEVLVMSTNHTTSSSTFQDIRQKLEAAIVQCEKEAGFLRRQAERQLENAEALRQTLDTLLNLYSDCDD